MRYEVDVPGTLRALGIAFRQRGPVELWAPCPWPWHGGERTPSWSVKHRPGHKSNGWGYCFGCGASGSLFDLVIERVELSGFAAALAYLRERGLLVGQSVPGTVRIITQLQRRQPCAVPPGIRFGELAAWPTVPRRYAHKRGITPQQVERWGIGYGTTGRLFCRLYLPARDAAGRVASWTGRSYAGVEPKYLDPEATDRPDRSVVYGEEFWPERADERRRTVVVVTEGELNALACERAGQPYVGALGGSGLDRGQALKLSSFGRLIVATDPDKAGSKVAQQLRAALARHANVAQAVFPAGLDACDVERACGSVGLAELIAGAEPWSR